MNTFTFYIDNQHITGGFLASVGAEVSYYISNGRVTIYTIMLPFYTLRYIDHTKLMPDVQAAAEHNAKSLNLLPCTQQS